MKYKKKDLPKRLSRALLRFLIPRLFAVEIKGEENFPKSGGMLLAGNHVAFAEVIMMIAYAPDIPEMMAGVELPLEFVTGSLMRFYGIVPIRRGYLDSAPLEVSKKILSDGGILGIFPEGGIWSTGRKAAQRGVSWLSYHGGVPVVPIGFAMPQGAIRKALHGKKPPIIMHVGEPIYPLKNLERQELKAYLDQHGERVMDQITDLLPEEYRASYLPVVEEEKDIHIKTLKGKGLELSLDEKEGLSYFLFAPGLIKPLRKNLRLKIPSFQGDPVETARDLELSAREIIHCLTNRQPAFFTYRLGNSEGVKVQDFLLKILEWAEENPQGELQFSGTCRRWTSLGELPHITYPQSTAPQDSLEGEN